MPRKQEVIRDYSFSDSHLILLCNEKRTFAERDVAEMSGFNIDNSYLNTFKTETDTFEELETDEVYEGIQIEKTELKDSSGETLKTAVRKIMTMAVNKYGEKSARVRRFGTKNMNEMDDEHLLACGRRVKRVSQSLLSELASEGLTQAIIDDLGTKNQDFEDKLDDQSEAIADRDIAVEERVEMGNALYDKLGKICRTGQNIWAEVNEAKHNDYIIYDSQGNAVEPPPENPIP